MQETNAMSRKALSGCVVAALLAAGTVARATEQASQQELLDRIKQLEQRLSEMEARTQEISVPSAEMPSKTLEFLGQTEVGGGVMASYFYDFSKPGRAGTKIPLEGVGQYQHNAFNPNMAEIYLSNPVTASAGTRASRDRASAPSSKWSMRVV